MARPKEVEKVVVQAKERSELGKSAASDLRGEGLIPGIVYGQGIPSIPVKVAAKDLSKALATKARENVLITLRVDSKPHTVLIKELQHHPVTHELIHVDFHEISLTKRITVSVGLSFQGESVGVKNQQGVLEHLRWDLEVECLPTEIPSEIPVDISSLGLNQVLHVKDIPLPTGVRLITEGEQPVIACIVPKKEEIPVPVTEEAAPLEPEVIKQKKPEEVEEGEAPAPPPGKEAKAKAKEAQAPARETKGPAAEGRAEGKKG